MSRMKSNAARMSVPGAGQAGLPASKNHSQSSGKATSRGGNAADATSKSTAARGLKLAGSTGETKPVAKKPTKKLTAGTAMTRAEFDLLPTTELWLEYRATSRVEIRNYFWEKYLPLVRYISEKTYSRLPDEVDVNDLMSAGQFGLMDAIDAFDLDKGVKFETYSATRIKGAILDELRAMDWVPRLVRHRTAKVSVIRDQFEMRNGRAPTQDEVSDALGATGEDLEKIMKDSGAVMTVSLNRKAFSSDGNKEVTEIDILKDDSQRSPLIETQRRDIKDLITKGLSRAERLIVTLYYYEEMTMKEIGQTLDLSESRVSQMHSSILARLKAQLQNKTIEIQPDDER